MAIEFKLPDIGEGVAEGEIVKWLVAEGDAVSEHQAVVEVMTDKATVEIPAPAAGTITKLLAAEGDVVPVGQVIFHLETAATPATPAPAPRAEAPAAPSGAAAAAAPSPPASPPPAPAPETHAKTIEFKLPDIGEGVAEGEIVKWLVAEGDTVAEHQAVVEVMTDKATVEIPAPAAGTITMILAAEGEIVPVGQVIFHLEVADGAPLAAPAAEPVAKAPAAAPAEPVAAAAPASAKPVAAAAARPRSNGKVLAVPSARRVARELGIDLAQVPGTGRNGVIRRTDVESFARGVQAGAGAPGAASGAAPGGSSAAAAPVARAERPAAPPVTLAPGERQTRKPFRGVRRKIAEAMTRSMYTAVHFTVVEELDVTELVKLRAEAKAIGAEQGIKVTYMPFIMKAVASGLARYPELNSQLDESTQEIVTYHHVDLGIATDTPQGLIVPVVREVQSKGLLQLASELADLAERTRSGKVTPEELRGSTFSITNAGNIGGTLATPVINFPEVGILGVHRIAKRPGVVETPDGDAFEVRQYMNLSLSVDHRLVDGASAVRFLVHLKRLLENPGLLSL